MGRVDTHRIRSATLILRCKISSLYNRHQCPKCTESTGSLTLNTTTFSTNPLTFVVSPMLSDVFDRFTPGFGLELRLLGVCAPYDFSRLGMIRTMVKVLLAAAKPDQYLPFRSCCRRELKMESWQVQTRLVASRGLVQGLRCVGCGVISRWSDGFTASSLLDDHDSTAENDARCRGRVYRAVVSVLVWYDIDTVARG